LNVDKTSLLNANGGITLNGNPFNAKAAGTTSFPTGNNTNYYSQHPPEVFFIQEPNAKQLKTYLLNFVPTDKNKEFGQDGQWTGTLYEWNLEGDTVLVQEIYKSKLIDRYAMKQYAPNVSNNQSKTSEEKLSLNDNKISKTWFGKLFDALADFIGWIGSAFGLSDYYNPSEWDENGGWRLRINFSWLTGADDGSGGGGGGGGYNGAGTPIYNGFLPGNTIPGYQQPSNNSWDPYPHHGNGGGPSQPNYSSSVNYLMNYLSLSAEQLNFLMNNNDIAFALENYLQTNGETPENIEFANWATGYLMENPGFNYHLFFDENEFSGINNPPANITEEAVINNGIKIGEVPDNAPQNQNRIIGSAPKRHGNNPEDLQYGTNGNTSGILSSMINKPNAQLFGSMRSLLWQTSILSPEMRTLTSQMADKFESNTGGTFENAILTKNVKQSVQYQNFLRKFGEDLGKELTRKSGNINQISEIKTNDYRPKFNDIWNKFAGLQIAINDTEANEVKLLNFRTEAGVLWYADIEVTIYDNFGLDKHDALIYQGKHSGFAAWWLLQHTRGFKPFVTKIVIKSSIEGRY
jgi:hypothetical protein